LIVHLKRFHHTKMSDSVTMGGRIRREKIDVLVNFPSGTAADGGLLDMQPYVLGPQKENLYELYAVSNHSGDLGFGHYTAYAKNFDNSNWYVFNDSSAYLQEGSRKMVTPEAYVLFYKRVEK
jgi:ubiquitin carboxyl-terminal hydrolase 4/11/15